jgi:16S rRNA (cytosine1402-N4)-methyltransferase
MNDDLTHVPVLLDQVLLALKPMQDEVFVDGTFGRGGYARALLDAASCRVIGIDRDPAAIAAGRILHQHYGERLTLIQGRFGEMATLVQNGGIARVDGVTLDIGVSSPQLDDPERGFSFRFDGPLDMRMGDAGPSAADIVNTLPEAELADVIFHLGEERMSRRVARAIVAARLEAPIERTTVLARIIRSVVPAARDGIDPATRTFQALRIFVNDELGELARGLAAAETLLRAGGRLAVVSFHSLEDRVVKNFLRTRSGNTPAGSRHLPQAGTARRPSFTLISRKAIVADATECRRNPRARSAKLRVAARTDAPSWPEEAVAA